MDLERVRNVKEQVPHRVYGDVPLITISYMHTFSMNQMHSSDDNAYVSNMCITN